MGKRSDFKRRKHDAYYTPYEAVLPLLPHLDGVMNFAEPCAGSGLLVQHLKKHGLTCYWQSDISPQSDDIINADAFVVINPLKYAGCIITNPPWTRNILHPMIEHFRMLSPTWLLFDADWAHTKQAIPYLEYCHKIVSVGRVSWMENGTCGKDNCVWYLFDKAKNEGAPLFYPKTVEVAV